MQTVTHSPKTGNTQAGNRNATDRKDRAKELRQRIDTSLDDLAQAVDDVRASETFRRYLDVQAKFHRYSWHNTMLIASQRPDATQVAGFQSWKKLKRHVRKGERGIRIFAPCRFTREVETTDGSTEEREGMFFRCVSVFDVGQTDGPDLPSVDVPTVQAAADDLIAKLVTVADSRGIAVRLGPLDGGTYGVSKRGSVDVDDQHPTGQQAKTLAHELAHEAMHWEDRGPLTRAIAELEAESVAFCVCSRFGLDVELRASKYIAIWGGDAKSLRASLERIAKAARSIIDDVETPASRKAVA